MIWIWIVTPLILAAVIKISLKYRDKDIRAVIVSIVHDRPAAAAGAVLTALLLVSSLVRGGPVALLGTLAPAFALGLLLATLIHRGHQPGRSNT